MARRRDNIGSFGDEESSSSSARVSGEVLSRVNANGVLKWLRPVKESRANAFSKRFAFPLHVRVSFSISGSQFVACTDGDRGVTNSIYWPEIHISEGLRFPLPPLVHQFLHFTQLPFTFM